MCCRRLRRSRSIVKRPLVGAKRAPGSLTSAKHVGDAGVADESRKGEREGGHAARSITRNAGSGVERQKGCGQAANAASRSWAACEGLQLDVG